VAQSLLCDLEKDKATPAANAAFEMIPARQSPNDPAMTNIAAENNTITDRAHARC
jgi:hypothetical protein